MKNKKVLSDGRWSCQSCGSCCRGFSFGPVEEHIIQGLKEKEISTHWEPAKDEWYITHPQTGDFYFTHIEGHCIFLQEDNLCAIHARWGEKAKPWFCREYPFSVVQDEQGMSITVRDDCGGFHKSMDHGEAVGAQVDDILSIIRPIPYPKFAPSQVVILPKLGVSVQNWLQVEPILLDLCIDSAQGSLRDIRQTLYRMAQREPYQTKIQIDDLYTMIIEMLIQRLQSIHVDPLMKSAQEYIVSMLQSCNDENIVQEEVEAYFIRIIRTRILSKAFARLGSLPAGLGFFLLEWKIFANRGTREDVGVAYSRWRRSIHLRPFWEVVRGFSDPFSQLFLSV